MMELKEHAQIVNDLVYSASRVLNHSWDPAGVISSRLEDRDSSNEYEQEAIELVKMAIHGADSQEMAEKLVDMRVGRNIFTLFKRSSVLEIDLTAARTIWWIVEHQKSVLEEPISRAVI